MGRRHYNSKVSPAGNGNKLEQPEPDGDRQDAEDGSQPRGQSVPRKAKWSDSIYHFTKISFFNVSVILVSLFILPVLVFKSASVNNTLMPARIMTKVSKILNWKWTLVGLEKLEPSKATTAVIMVNHQSTFDILGLFELWPYVGRMTVIAKRSLKFTPFFGLVASKCGIIFIDRKKKKEAHRIIEVALEECKLTGTKLLIFPEGTVNHDRDGNFLPFKKGGFSAAITSQVPIIPIVFSPFDFLHKSKRKFYPGKTTIQVLDPVSTVDLTQENLDGLSDQIRTQMLQVLRHFSGS